MTPARELRASLPSPKCRRVHVSRNVCRKVCAVWISVEKISRTARNMSALQSSTSVSMSDCCVASSHWQTHCYTLTAKPSRWLSLLCKGKRKGKLIYTVPSHESSKCPFIVTQLNSTQLNSTRRRVEFSWVALSGLKTWVELSWAELRRYRHFADATQLNSTSCWVQLSCVALSGLKTRVELSWVASL